MYLSRSFLAFLKNFCLGTYVLHVGFTTGGNGKPVASADGFTCGFVQVVGHHFADQFSERCSWSPAQLFFCLGRISQEGFHFGGAKVVRVHGNEDVTGLKGSRPAVARVLVQKG